MRQQVQALAWTLGHEHINWTKTQMPQELKELFGKSCTAARYCLTDIQDNITLCFQFMGNMASNVYHEQINSAEKNSTGGLNVRNYTLDIALLGHGDSSCLLRDDMIADLAEFDVVFVQSVAWWVSLKTKLSSATSPEEWVLKMTPVVYYDALNAFLTKISKRTQTVFVLGQIGSDCQNKTEPELFAVSNIPDNYGWTLAPKLWNTSLALIEEQKLNVQVVDARDPLMQSVHAHPSRKPDCLHFCMVSAAVNIYLDLYWNEVFSQFL